MLTIAGVEIDPPCVLAPMAGVTDRPFRLLCRQAGAGLVYTEFVSAHGYVQDNRKTHSMLLFSPEERPLGIQLFGHDPAALAEAAQGVAAEFKPDLIDLNFGCPVRKVVRKGAGAALLKDLPKLERMAAAVVQAVPLPVTAKIRSGWDEQRVVVTEAVKRLEAAGVKAVTLHPRTVKQGYQGQADWSLIREAKEAAPDLVIIGNGDVRTPEDAQRMLRETCCDAVMIGRGALGRPWLFTQIKELFATGTYSPEPPINERLAVAYAHFRLAQSEWGSRAVNRIKKHLGWYLRGFPGAVEFRRRIFQADRNEQLEAVFHDLARQVGPLTTRFLPTLPPSAPKVDRELQLVPGYDSSS